MLHQKRLLTRRSCTLPVSLFKFSTTSTSSSVLHQQQLSSSPSSQSRRVFENLSGLSAKELQQKLSPKDRILPSSSPSSTNNSTTHILYKKEETVAKVFAASPSYANAFLATIAKKPEVQAAYDAIGRHVERNYPGISDYTEAGVVRRMMRDVKLQRMKLEFHELLVVHELVDFVDSPTTSSDTTRMDEGGSIMNKTSVNGDSSSNTNTGTTSSRPRRLVSIVKGMSGREGVDRVARDAWMRKGMVQRWLEKLLYSREEEGDNSKDADGVKKGV